MSVCSVVCRRVLWSYLLTQRGVGAMVVDARVRQLHKEPAGEYSRYTAPALIEWDIRTRPSVGRASAGAMSPCRVRNRATTAHQTARATVVAAAVPQALQAFLIVLSALP